MEKRIMAEEAAAARDAELELQVEQPPPRHRAAGERGGWRHAADGALTPAVTAAAPLAAERPVGAPAPAATAAASSACSSPPQEFPSCMPLGPLAPPTAALKHADILPQLPQEHREQQQEFPWEDEELQRRQQPISQQQQQPQHWIPQQQHLGVRPQQQWPPQQNVRPAQQQQQQSVAQYEHAARQERKVDPFQHQKTEQEQQQQRAANPTPSTRPPQLLHGGSSSNSSSDDYRSSSNSSSSGGENSNMEPRMEEVLALLLRRRKIRSSLQLVVEAMQQPELVKNRRTYLRLLSVKVHCLLALKDGAGIAAALKRLPAPLTAATYWRDGANAAAPEEDFLPFSLRLALACTPVICAAGAAEALDGLFALLRWVKNKAQRLLRRCSSCESTTSSSDSSNDSSVSHNKNSNHRSDRSGCSSSAEQQKTKKDTEEALQLWVERYTRVAFLLVEALVGRGYAQEAVQLLQEDVLPLRRAVNPQTSHSPTLSLMGRTALRAGFFDLAEECFDYAACCCPETAERELISKIDQGLLAALSGKTQAARAAFISAQRYAEEIATGAAGTRLATAAAEAVAADAIAAAAASSGGFQEAEGGSSVGHGAAAAARLAVYVEKASKAEAAAAALSNTDSSSSLQQQSKETVDYILAVPPHPTPLAAVASNLAVANMYEKRLDEAAFVLEAALARCPEESLFTGGVRNLLTLYEFSCSRDACVSQLASLANAAAVEDPALLSLLSTAAPTQRVTTPP